MARLSNLLGCILLGLLTWHFEGAAAAGAWRRLLQGGACPAGLSECYTTPYTPQPFCCDSSFSHCSGAATPQCQVYLDVPGQPPVGSLVPAALIPGQEQPAQQTSLPTQQPQQQPAQTQPQEPQQTQPQQPQQTQPQSQQAVKTVSAPQNNPAPTDPPASTPAPTQPPVVVNPGNGGGEQGSKTVADGGFTQAIATYFGNPDGTGFNGGACGFGSNIGNLPIVAIPPSLFGLGTTFRGPGCGKCYYVQCVDTLDFIKRGVPQPCKAGNGIVVRATDLCPECDTVRNDCKEAACQKHIDLSANAFNQIANQIAGIITINFKEVSCDFRP